MLNRRSVLTACGAAILVLAMAVSVNAWGTARRTMHLTFSAPFALPGVSLPAGTYIFERADVATRDVVRVSSRDRSHVYLTVFTTLISRPKNLHADRHVLFGEVPRGVTPPIRIWYPMGESIGHQFIYAENSPQLTGLAGN